MIDTNLMSWKLSLWLTGVDVDDVANCRGTRLEHWLSACRPIANKLESRHFPAHPAEPLLPRSVRLLSSHRKFAIGIGASRNSSAFFHPLPALFATHLVSNGEHLTLFIVLAMIHTDQNNTLSLFADPLVQFGNNCAGQEVKTREVQK